MTDVSSEGQQACVHLKWGWLPVVMVRKAHSEDGYIWGWGQWRMARLSEVVSLNALLMKTWRD